MLEMQKKAEKGGVKVSEIPQIKARAYRESLRKLQRLVIQICPDYHSKSCIEKKCGTEVGWDGCLTRMILEEISEAFRYDKELRI